MRFYSIVFGQKEADNWYFGNHAGITFKSGTPSALSDGNLNTWEGVATISDSLGNLLFYTDGTTVYNSKNQAMPKGQGLFGNFSSTQSAVIVKKPGSTKLYYLFTIDRVENSGRNGLCYSVVDMSLNGGLGDVTTKNFLLRAPALEKLTVVKHKNNRDFWILINDFLEDDIFAYHVSCEGVDTIPVKSRISPINGVLNVSNFYGYLKASRQNDKLALAISSQNIIDVFDFDNNSGRAFNKKILQGSPTSLGGPYGLEFSRDGNLLYAAAITNPRLVQFNLNAGTGTDIFNSAIVLATHATKYTFNAYYYGALQLGPDGKIYSDNNGDSFLGVINNPDIPGLSCNYISNGISLNGKICLLGLPNFLTDYAYPLARDTIYATICDSQFYALPDNSQVDSPGIYTTHLSSANVCDSIIITKLTVKHRSFSSITAFICTGQSYEGHTESGMFVDTLMAINGCDSIRTLQLTVKPLLYFTIAASVCSGESYEGYTKSGTYLDTLIASNGCDSIRTIVLTVNPVLYTTITASICDGQNYHGYIKSGTYVDTLLSVTGCDSIRTVYLTVKPSSFSTIAASICDGQIYQGHTQSGIYTDTLKASNGCDSIQTLHLTVKTRAYSNVSQSICEGQSYLGHATSGIFIDTLTAEDGCDSIRTLNLNVTNDLKPDLGADQLLCSGDSVILSPGKFDSYVWQNGSTSSRFVASQPGIYSVRVSNSCGIKQASVHITEQQCIIGFPNSFTPNGDGINDQFHILNAQNIQDFHLSIFDRWGLKVFESYDKSKSWNGTFKQQPETSGIFVWICTYKKSNVYKTFQGTVTLIR